MKDLDANYVPIDFAAYSIEDSKILLNKQKPLEDDDKIWRISSMTAFVDEETKILLLPVPESKRSVKIKDTTYSFKKVEDLLNNKAVIEKALEGSDDEEISKNKRFEDKT